MTTATATRASFEALVTRLAEVSTTLTERELLEASHWSLGEDAWLREDVRFRETPWGRWMMGEDLLANDTLYRWMHAERRGKVNLEAALRRVSEHLGKRCVFCPSDPRLVLRDEEIQLSASELTRQPVIDHEVSEVDEFTTHLPLHSLKAAAASEPAGQWGRRAPTQDIETLGWVRVTLKGRSLNERMFLAEIEGHSMDDGRSGLVDGGLAVFELWPSGSQQHLNVLVRGAFHDPETGSYAVKKYVAGESDGDGRYQRVALVSLNPDKERFPDIELAAEDEGEVTVVAKVVQPLSPDDYERLPRPRRRPGRRILVGAAGVGEQGERLSRRLAAFFGEPSAKPEADSDEETLPTGWLSRIVALSPDAGGLHLEVGPLGGLPAFVRKLRLVGREGDESIVMATNLRVHPARVRVAPGRGPWRWEAVGFEDETELGLDRLALAGLDIDAPTLFRIDVEGVGQRVETRVLAAGQAYWLLLAPGLAPEVGDELGEGWRLWGLDLEHAASISAKTHEVLSALGLSLGEAWPRLEWSVPSPATWRMSTRGESYPVFEEGTEPIVSVMGTSLSAGDALALFLQGPLDTERLAVSGDGHFSLGRLSQGRWACALLHSRSIIPPTTLIFEVASGVQRVVSAVISASAPTGLDSLVVTAPPGWPVTLRWRVHHEEAIATLYADEDGSVDLAEVQVHLHDRARRTRLADLVVDFGELGRKTFPHERRPTLEAVQHELAALWRQRADLVRSRVGAWLFLRPHWFEPVTALLGYDLEVVPPTEQAPTEEEGAAVWRLAVVERLKGVISRSPSRVLVLTADLSNTLSSERDQIDRACANAGVREALLSDGERWTLHRRGQRLTRTVWHISDCLEDHVRLRTMLAELGEGH